MSPSPGRSSRPPAPRAETEQRLAARPFGSVGPATSPGRRSALRGRSVTTALHDRFLVDDPDTQPSIPRPENDLVVEGRSRIRWTDKNAPAVPRIPRFVPAAGHGRVLRLPWSRGRTRGRAPAPFGGVVKLLVSAAAVAALAWFTAPWVSMACRGTLDHRALEAMRREAVIPAPRRAPDDMCGTRSSGLSCDHVRPDEDEGVVPPSRV